ncbi:Sorting nexin, cytoplasm-to-vacuole targeting pathway/endosomal sorting [Maudiozyma exigua]|uniref:Autophagy-related protein 20 n=1 Tax=Maudiozyma exigua TaxID=34358 RepID=A0A9P6WCU6_MAUEX|nr:Sorting nexin, cytoplasm-to-vacuole targeting pathway/endosomal sorting [Kazachstania exigua]
MAKNRNRKGKKTGNHSNSNVTSSDEINSNIHFPVNAEIMSSENSPDQLIGSEKTPENKDKTDLLKDPGNVKKDIEADKDHSDLKESKQMEDKDEASLVEARMVHTAIIEKDNPFIDAKQDTKNDSNDQSGKVDKIEKVGQPVTVTEKSQSILNPNTVYENDNDDELILPRKQDPLKKSKNGNVKVQSIKPSNVNNGKNNNTVNQTIQILEANKISEGQGRAYVAYTIKYGEHIVKRRYSDFESLKNILGRLFPTSLIPPIPKKETIKTYGKAITGNTNDFSLPSDDIDLIDLSSSVINENIPSTDAKLIRHRIRILTLFLEKVLQNEEINRTSIITDFLEPNHTNWNEFVASSPTFSSLPRNILNCNPLDPTNTSRLYVSLPVPSSTQLIIPKEVRSVSTTPKRVKEKFDLIDQEYRLYENIISNGIYKHNKRATKIMYDLKADYNEIKDVTATFVKDSQRDIGIQEQLVHISDLYSDSSVLLEQLVSRLHYNVSEPLSETVGMAGSARELIKFRRLKYLQNDMIKKSLSSKQKQLAKLTTEHSRFSHMDEAIDEAVANSQQISLQRPSTDPNNNSRGWFSKFNKIATMVKDTVSYQEIDPKLQAKELKKEIEQLQIFHNVTEPDLKKITDIIQSQALPIFEKDRAEEITRVMKNHAKYMRTYAQKNLELWKNLKRHQTQNK